METKKDNSTPMSREISEGRKPEKRSTETPEQREGRLRNRIDRRVAPGHLRKDAYGVKEFIGGTSKQRRSTSDGYMPKRLTPAQKEDRQVNKMIKQSAKETLGDTPANREKSYRKARGLSKADIARGQVS